MISFARILILDLVLLSIVLNTQYIGCVPIWFHMELFEELCNRSEAFLLAGPFQEDLRVSERQFDVLCPPLFLLDLFPIPIYIVKKCEKLSTFSHS